MNALIRKELRQILPAQLFLALLATVGWFVLVDPDQALSPYDSRQGLLHFTLATFGLVEGLILGTGQFGSERWLGTEAYLVHRKTGREGAFRAKVLAAFASLALLVLLPPLAYGTFHSLQHPYAGSASIARLAQATVASGFAFAGYAAGACASQVLRGIGRSLLLATFGFSSLILILGLSVMPTTGLPQPSWARFALVLLALVGACLVTARQGFLARRPARNVLSRCTGVLGGVVALALILPAFLFANLMVQGALWVRWDDDATHVVQDASGALYVATPLDVDRESLRAKYPKINPYGRVYELVDQAGARVPPERALEYAGHGSTADPFATVYAPFMLANGPLDVPDPRPTRAMEGAPFVFGGPWHQGSQSNFDWCLDGGRGALWVRRSQWLPQRRGPLSGTPQTHWLQLDGLQPGVRPVWSVSRNGNAQAVFLDLATGRFQRLVEWSDGRPALVEEPLPDGDRFVSLEPLVSAHSARIGYRGLGSGELVRGERDVYAWNGETWNAWSRIELADRMELAAPFEVAGLQEWKLDFEYEGGVAQRIALRDVRTGETSLTLDVGASKSSSGLWKAFTATASMALPPALAVLAWTSEKRTAANPYDLEHALSTFDLLRGRSHTWLLALLALLTLAMARDLWRRLRHGRAPLELRLWWCAATVFVGLPAYFACRLLEAHAVVAPRNEPPVHARPARYEIRTA